MEMKRKMFEKVDAPTINGHDPGISRESLNG